MVWVGALLFVASGCGRSGVLDESAATDGGDVDAPLPHGDPEWPTPDPIVTPIVDAGRGLDGSIVFDVSEEIDECVPVDVGGGTEIELASSSGLFGAGRRVLVVQMNDAIGVSGPTAAVSNFGRAGQWEIAEIADVAGNTLLLAAPLAHANYESHLLNGHRAQACLVREYVDVTIASGAAVRARAWDGDRGGIIAWQVNRTLHLEAGGRLSANASGFRGGMCGSPATNENVTSFDVPLGSGGGKGEGLDARFFLRFGRGAVTNGGGGGNGLNAGGGGGGGAGRGGIGGGQTNATGILVIGADPMRGFAGGGAASDARLVFGGGGGAGHLNGVELDRCGGAGGGALVVRAALLSGAGLIAANGESGIDVNRDGGGGGGGGGTIDFVVASASAFCGVLSADGGDGADVENNSFSTFYGPGGGGGGGSVRAKGISATIHAFGGDEGRNTTSGVSWDAEGGEPGVALFP